MNYDFRRSLYKTSCIVRLKGKIVDFRVGKTISVKKLKDNLKFVKTPSGSPYSVLDVTNEELKTAVSSSRFFSLRVRGFVKRRDHKQFVKIVKASFLKSE